MGTESTMPTEVEFQLFNSFAKTYRGHGTDVAIESSDVVLMRSDLLDVVSALELSKATIKNIKENLFWAFFYNTIGIPLAAGLLFPAFGIKLSPMFAAFAMSMSSVFVVNNALRLRRFKPRGVKRSLEESNSSSKKEKVDKQKDLEKSEKITRIEVEGMMCGHCEKRVADALEKTGKAKNVVASHENSSVEFIDQGLSSEEIKNAIEDAGYKIIKNKGEDSMEKILNVEGMSCKHCVASVRKALEGLDGVREADVNLDDKKARVELDKDLADEVLVKAVEDAGFSAKIEK